MRAATLMAYTPSTVLLYPRFLINNLLVPIKTSIQFMYTTDYQPHTYLFSEVILWYTLIRDMSILIPQIL